MIQREDGDEKEGDAESRVGVSIDHTIKIDGRLDEYLPGIASSELGRHSPPHCERD